MSRSGVQWSGLYLYGVLAGVALMLLAWILWQWQQGADLPQDAAGDAPSVQLQIPSPQGLAPAPLSSYSEMVERPLFWPSREPVPEEEPVAESGPEPASPPEGYELRGIVLTSRGHIALLSKGGEDKRVREGDYLEGWKVVRIEPRKLHLEHQEDSYTMPLIGEEDRQG